MKWYVVMKEDVDLESLSRRLLSVGCRCDDGGFKPVLLGSNEQAIEVDGPEDLSEQMVDDHDVVSVCPEIAFD